MAAYEAAMQMLENFQNMKENQYEAFKQLYKVKKLEKNGFVPLNDADIRDKTRLLYFDMNDVSDQLKKSKFFLVNIIIPL